jgi:geranylgeranyl diphosphate synthase type II
MQEVQEYQAILEKRVSELDFPPTPKNLYDPLRYFLKLGGKRTRPTLAMLGCSLFGEPGIKALNVALAVELFHNFTLLHDDIMDEAPLRRGQQTVHEKWDANIGILSGDVLFVEAFDYLSKNDAAVLPELLTIFNRTAKEVCEGQQMDMDFESTDSVNIDQYIEMIRLKTSVLLGAALEMGACVAKANDADKKHLYDFGMNIGLAFQLHDDLLDLYADPDKFGKQVGGDILSNKKTFLLLKAKEIASAEQRALLNEIIQNEEGEEKVSMVKAIFNEIGIKAETEKIKLRFYNEALKNIEAISVPEENKKALLGLAKMLMDREH